MRHNQADFVDKDRVFSQCLTAVRQISRFSSRRPPSRIRAKLYGLYKQGVEGDLKQLVGRPDVSGEEQDKWDAWSAQAGLSKTEAKRHYIELLIETMHEYASETADARELVTELEFVYNQIKDNSPPGTETSQSEGYGLLSASHGQTPGAYPISPLPTPGLHQQSQGGLQELDPASHDEAAIQEEQVRALQAGLRSPEMEHEFFVDAPEQSVIDEDSEQQSVSAAHSSSQQPGPMAMRPDSIAQSSSHEDSSPAESAFPRSWPQQSNLPPAIKAEHRSSPLRPEPEAPSPLGSKINPAAALLPSLAQYLPSSSKAKAETSKSETTAASVAQAAQTKWYRRIETSLIRLTTEVTALREQLDIQQQQNNSYSSLFPIRNSVSFPGGPNGKGVGKLSFRDVVSLYAQWALRWLIGVARHVVIDAAVILGIWFYVKKRRGWSNERFAQEIVSVLGAIIKFLGPLIGAWNGFYAKLPIVPGLHWFVMWLRDWVQALLGTLRRRLPGTSSGTRNSRSTG